MALWSGYAKWKFYVFVYLFVCLGEEEWSEGASATVVTKENTRLILEQGIFFWGEANSKGFIVSIASFFCGNEEGPHDTFLHWCLPENCRLVD